MCPDYGQHVQNATSRQQGNYVMPGTFGSKTERLLSKGASFTPLNPPTHPEMSSWNRKGSLKRNPDQGIILEVDLNPRPYVIVEQSACWSFRDKGLLVLVKLEFKEIHLSAEFSIVSLIGLHFSLHSFMNAALGTLISLKSRLPPFISFSI